MRIRKLVVTALVAALPLGGSVACAVGPYEDCEVSDQEVREPDCGYWTLNGVNRSGAQPGKDWVWVFFSWVNVGRDSSPHKDWKPPRGTKPPREDADSSGRKRSSTSGGSTSTTPKKIDQKKAKDTSSVGGSSVSRGSTGKKK